MCPAQWSWVLTSHASRHPLLEEIALRNPRYSPCQSAVSHKCPLQFLSCEGYLHSGYPRSPAVPMKARVRVVEIERHDDLKLLLGGKHGYLRVRGGVGPNSKDQYQGYTKDNKNTTAAFHTPREAAIALAELERDLAAGLNKAARKKRKTDACMHLRFYPNA